MQGLREERDPDWEKNRRSVTEIKTAENPFELFCDICNKPLYVDKSTLDRVNDMVEKGLENPLVCDSCRQEQEELAYGAG